MFQNPKDALDEYWKSKEATAELEQQAEAQRRNDEDCQWVEDAVFAFKQNPEWGVMADEQVASLVLWLADNANELGSEWLPRYQEAKAWKVLTMPEFWRRSTNPTPQYERVRRHGERYEKWKVWRTGR